MYFRSSVEDKVAQTIRQLPIPKGLKVKNKTGSFSGGEDEDSQFEDDYGLHEDEDDTMDSNSSSANQNQPTSNLVAPDSLKRQHAHQNSNSVRFSEEIEDLGMNLYIPLKSHIFIIQFFKNSQVLTMLRLQQQQKSLL